jgi:protein-disulfide isomerase
VLIGGVVAVGVIGLFALLFLSFQEPEQQTLADYCEANPESCVTQGAEDAPVTIVEVSDFGCSHCRNFHAETLPLIKEQYINNGQVQWVTLPYALSQQTLPAANAAMCAEEQGAYAEYSEALFAQQQDPIGLTREGFLQAGEAVGLDMESFSTCLAEGRYNGLIQDNINAARDSRVSATPTFFLDGQALEGALPFSVFQQRINAAINS